MKNRNMNARNFGLGSRDMGRALTAAYRQAGNGDNANAQAQAHCARFANFMREEYGIKDARKIDRSHVRGYAAHLRERFEAGEISASTAQNYLSPINKSLAYARRDHALHVNGVRDAGLPSRSGVASSDHSVTAAQHAAAKSAINERTGALLELQRQLGLRFKESALIDARSALEQAETTGKVLIEAGTKGGRARELPITAKHQVEALRTAAAIQKSDRSMIPADQTWRQFQSESYREMQDVTAKFHGERHHYANERYQQLAGVAAPARAGIPHAKRHAFIAKELGLTTAQARELDHQVRAQVSAELGHSRISITNAYLG